MLWGGREEYIMLNMIHPASDNDWITRKLQLPTAAVTRSAILSPILRVRFAFASSSQIELTSHAPHPKSDD